MSKIIVLLFLLFSFLIPRKIFAGQWTRSNQNPILSSSNSWDNNVASPTVIKDEGKLKMWYQGFGNLSWSIGYAESSDGIEWHRVIDQPILSPENSEGVIETGIVEPSVVKTDKYYLWYNSQNNGIYKIRYASSNNGIDWEKKSGYVLVGKEPWESNGVANPTVIFKDGKFYMWYMGWGSGGWKIGLAESTDGINWSKQQNNPLTLSNLGHVGGQSVIFINGKFHMFYHTGDSIPNHIYHVISDDGINWSCEGDCNVLSTSSEGFDSYMVVYPEVINYNSNLYLFYTGHNGNLWQIGLASEQPIVVYNKPPIIIIPGLFASWNKEAIIYNKTVTYSDWRLNAFVKEYKGLKESLINLGNKESEDFYIFPYDWRQPVEQTTDDLNNFLKEKIWNKKPTQKINIVGHSLGGLVGRVFSQKYQDKINRIISVGTPHQGAVQVYKPIEAGQLDRDNTFLWLAEKLILILNKSTLEDDKEIIKKRFPVTLDLFPTFNFLKDTDNNEISSSDLTIKNNLLLKYNQTFSQIFPFFFAIYGEKDSQTPAGYVVEPANTINKLFGNYIDGQPKSVFYGTGDYTVLSKSSNFDEDSEKLNLDHGEIVADSSAIKKIFSLLNLSFQDNQITAGEKTVISPSLIFIIRSPAEMTVKYTDQEFHEDDSLIFIPNAQTGSYQLSVQGTDVGKYTINVGQIAEDNEVWEEINGEIKKSPPSSQTDSYIIEYNRSKANSFLPTPTPILTLTPTQSASQTTSSISTNTTESQSLESNNSEQQNSSKSSLEANKNIQDFQELLKPLSQVLGITKKKTDQPQKTDKENPFLKVILPSFITSTAGVIGYILKKRFSKK